MLEFIKIDKETYEVRVAAGGDSNWEVAGVLVKDEDGMWNFEYDGQSIAYEDSLEETKVDLEEEFENGKKDYMSCYFGNYKYNK